MQDYAAASSAGLLIRVRLLGTGLHYQLRSALGNTVRPHRRIVPLPYHTFLGPIQHFGFSTGSLFASQSLKKEGERLTPPAACPSQSLTKEG